MSTICKCGHTEDYHTVSAFDPRVNNYVRCNAPNCGCALFQASEIPSTNCTCGHALATHSVLGKCNYCSCTIFTAQREQIDHPHHYNMGKYEVIDVIEDWKLGFNLGNAVKYIARAEHKNGVEDIKKAIWYLQRYLGENKKNG